MKLGFIGDIVGKPGRDIIAKHLLKLREEYGLDLVIANYENASHGFGLTKKNCDELLSYGIDVMTGGNHSWDKKEVFSLYEDYPLIRPINYPRKSPGEGLIKVKVLTHEVAILNVMGHYTMPMVDNPFVMMDEVVDKLLEEGIKHIIVDIHAEATSEKLAMMHILKQRVSALLGTHTHVGTDDLMIVDGCCYVSDVGLTGCRDGVIGMHKDIPINRFLTGISGHYDIAKKCQNILQVVVFELDDDGRSVNAEKIKIYDNGEVRQFDARIESY
ncbi:MAG: Phosphoesterase family protein [uncultured Sulfurovum sp.]|uniref:Phosphoesterase family protein n=1 Tax=uncultured Sulfurovum sp. TaxID=269237 RepID=A0A6S6SJA8_9BACT|nr:MAG: Phosphoesterase family protein [uncultured Sulfurovum sp.]